MAPDGAFRRVRVVWKERWEHETGGPRWHDSIRTRCKKGRIYCVYALHSSTHPSAGMPWHPGTWPDNGFPTRRRAGCRWPWLSLADRDRDAQAAVVLRRVLVGGQRRKVRAGEWCARCSRSIGWEGGEKTSHLTAEGIPADLAGLLATAVTPVPMQNPRSGGLARVCPSAGLSSPDLFARLALPHYCTA